MLVYNKSETEKFEIIDENDFVEYSEVREEIQISEILDENFNIIRPARIDYGKILSFTGIHISHDNIIGYYNHGFELLLYKKCRDIIKSKVNEIGFENLNDGEKNIACELLIATQDQRSAIHTIQQQIEFGTIWQFKSKDYRQERINKVFSELYNRLNTTDIQSILSIINPLVDNYLKYGINSKAQDNIVGLYDYFLSQEDFIDSGFSIQTFDVNGFANCNEFATYIITLLNGDII